MNFTGLDAFDRTIHTSNTWLNDLQRSLGWDERGHAYAAFRAVVHALRDRLPREEAHQLAAQLPMLLAGVYVQGWRPGSTPARMDEAEFLERVGSELEKTVPGADPRWAVECVVDLLSTRVSSGELSDVLGVLPQELRELWTSPFPGAGPAPAVEPEPIAPPGGLEDWNVVSTSRPDGAEESLKALSRLATVGRTGYVNVFVARAEDPDRFLEGLRGLAEDTPGLLERNLSRAVPLWETFDFGAP